MSSILSLLDSGDTTTIFENILNSIKQFNTIGEITENLLEVGKTKSIKIDKLSKLLHRYDSDIKPNLRINSLVITKSVTKWIFHTNKIESFESDTEERTEHIIECGFSNKTNKEKEVLQTLELLKTTYLPEVYNNNNLGKYMAFDLSSVKTWHTIMMADMTAMPGIFRKEGVYTTNMDLSIHRFPHHSMIETSLIELSRLSYNMAEYINVNYKEHNKRLQYIIALAAFVQFHFIELHPFVDGNGRMCRYLSKRILDSILPVPIPIFANRYLYLKILEICRNTFPHSIYPLYELILDTALDHYNNIMRDYTSLNFKDVIVASTIKNLISEIRQKEYSKHIQIFIDKFKNLNNSEYTDFVIDGTNIRLKKFPEFCINDI